MTTHLKFFFTWEIQCSISLRNAIISYLNRYS